LAWLPFVLLSRATKKSQHQTPQKDVKHWLIGSGLFVIDHNFFPAPGTEQRETNHPGNAGHNFGFGFLPTLRTEQETLVIGLHLFPPAF
jgi:hypothetical protein